MGINNSVIKMINNTVKKSTGTMQNLLHVTFTVFDFDLVVTLLC